MTPRTSRGASRLTTALALGSMAFAGACVQPAPTPAPEPVTPERVVSIEPRPAQPSFDRTKPPTLATSATPSALATAKPSTATNAKSA